MRFALILLFALAACTDDSRNAHIAAAGKFTQHYAQSRLGKWDVRATAAGSDCTVLLVEASIVMDDFMVDALHHGTGAYDVYTGGVQKFADERGFRSVAYRDPRNRVWRFGPATGSNALEPCS